MKITLTSEDLRNHFGDQVSDELHFALVDQGIITTAYAWSIIVEIDEYTLEEDD